MLWVGLKKFKPANSLLVGVKKEAPVCWLAITSQKSAPALSLLVILYTWLAVLSKVPDTLNTSEDWTVSFPLTSSTFLASATYLESAK